MVYLFIGQDSFSKDTRLKHLRQELFSPQIEQFNLDILYAKELSLKVLQEKFLCLPIKAKRRLIVIKDAEALKEEIKEFLLKEIKHFSSHITLVLDIRHTEDKDEFIKRISRHAQVYRSKETVPPDTFTLARGIELKKPDYALRLLQQLLQNRQRPEWILGGLRYSWERSVTHPLEKRKRLRLLLNCDREIKTGRVKPSFALEKLVINLCCLGKPFS